MDLLVSFGLGTFGLGTLGLGDENMAKRLGNIEVHQAIALETTWLGLI
jgi:hypothetical protein